MKRKIILSALVFGVLSYFTLQLRALPQIKYCALSSGTLQLHNALKCIDGNAILALAILSIVLLSGIILLWLRPQIIDNAFNKKRLPLIILTVSVAIIAIFCLAPGEVAGGDSAGFMGSVQYAYESLRHLSIPFYNFYCSGGASLFSAYGFLTQMTIGLISLLTGNIEPAAKIYFYLTEILGAVIAFMLIDKIAKNKKAAFIGALAYSFSFVHIGRIMFGRITDGLIYLFFPLLLLIFENYIEGKMSSFKATLLIGLTAIALFFTHPPDGTMLIASFVLYALVRSAFLGKIKNALKLSGAAAIFLLATSFWIIPFITEKETVSASDKATEVISLKLPALSSVIALVKWPGQAVATEYNYIGLSILALAIIGAIFVFRTRHKAGMAVAITWIATLMLVLFQSARYYPVLVLMASVLAGFAMLTPGIAKRRRAFVIILLILLIDLFPATLTNLNTNSHYEKSIYNEIAKDTSDYRVLDLQTTRRTFWSANLYTFADLQTVFTTIIESSPKNVPYAAAISQKAAQEIYDNQSGISKLTHQELELLDVKYLIIHSSQRGIPPEKAFGNKSASLGLERNLVVYMFNNTQIVASQNTECCFATSLDNQQLWNMRLPFENREIDSAAVDAIVMRMNISGNTAALLPLKEGSNESLGNGTLVLKINSVKTELTKVSLEVELNMPAYLMLAYAYYPWLEVKMDGTSAKYSRTAFNTIAIKAGEGTHHIEITGHPSPLRRNLFYIAIATIAACLLLLLYPTKTAK
jgi:hypothetical protein